MARALLKQSLFVLHCPGGKPLPELALAVPCNVPPELVVTDVPPAAIEPASPP